MMKRNKLKKILFVLLLIPSIFTIKIKYVNAGFSYGSSGSGIPGGGNGYGGDSDSGSSSGTPTYGSKCDSVSCKITHSYQTYGETFVDIKKEDGTIEDWFSPNFSTEFLAGTSVMLRVYEEQKFTTTASYSVSAKRQVWTCSYYNWVPNQCCAARNKKGACIRYDDCGYYSHAYTSEEECSCSGSADKVEPSFKGWKDVTSEYIASCSAAAIPAVITLTPSYSAFYEDSNDIEPESSSDKYYTAETIEGHECEKPVKGKKPGKNNADGYTSANTLSGSCSVSYDRIGNICINVKNGKVRYISKKEKCQTLDEYTITPDEDGFWKYFIPLNANSANKFKLTLNPTSKQKKSTSECMDIINKYDDYAYKITDSNGNSFIGKNITKKKAKQMVSNGCYLKSIITFPVVQKFYNEQENGINFKGFNFYYKPIDITKPFPNGLTDTSLWYDWNKNTDKNPDISESYKKKTYIAKTSGNESTIRDYSEDNPYISWDKMNKNGTSQFIKNEGIVVSNVNLNSFYPLGCGPWNEKQTNEDGSKNYFYQPECDRS